MTASHDARAGRVRTQGARRGQPRKRPAGGGIAYNAGMAATSMRELAAEAAGGPRERRLYDRDFWAWTQEQAGALRRREFGAIDWDNVIEEVESLGREQKSAWKSYCANVISHLLKIEHSPATASIDHWRKEVLGWRREMHSRLSDNPSLKGELGELLGKAWRYGRAEGVEKLAEHARPASWAAEKRILRDLQRGLPQDCPYALVDIAGYDPSDMDAEPDADVWPATVARRLNEALGADYPVRFRGPEREGGRSR